VFSGLAQVGISTFSAWAPDGISVLSGDGKGVGCPLKKVAAISNIMRIIAQFNTQHDEYAKAIISHYVKYRWACPQNLSVIREPLRGGHALNANLSQAAKHPKPLTRLDGVRGDMLAYLDACAR